MVSRHDEYYFEDGNVVFQVGETLFRIHKRLLIGSESSVFASIFSLPPSEAIEGQTDERPIVLEGDSLEQFEALMKILYPELLENLLDIPVITYAQAMRIAVKYAMDDVQVAIAKVIQLIPPHPPSHPQSYALPGLGTAILRLALVAEFPSHFSKGVAIQVFTQASSIDNVCRPTAHQLEPLMPYPVFVALMMQYREELHNPDAAKRIKQHNGTPPWLDHAFGRFEFKQR